jgi:hypothetical protein
MLLAPISPTTIGHTGGGGLAWPRPTTDRFRKLPKQIVEACAICSQSHAIHLSDVSRGGRAALPGGLSRKVRAKLKPRI